jgi:hypothetical protein
MGGWWVPEDNRENKTQRPRECRTRGRQKEDREAVTTSGIFRPNLHTQKIRRFLQNGTRGFHLGGKQTGIGQAKLDMNRNW